MQRVRQVVARLARSAWLALGFLLALPLRLLDPVYRIEVQRLLAGRIGHLAIEPELFLCIREQHPRPRTRTVFFSHPPVANPFLLSMWRRALPTGPAWLLRPMFEASERWPWLALGARDWDELHFDLRPLDSSTPHVAFTPAEEERGRRLLVDLGVPEGTPFVCLAVRDSAYLAATVPDKDWSYHDYRDSDITTYVPMAESLARAGYAVLRMGALVQEPLVSTNTLVIDYANSPHRSDFADVYLFAHCAFCISTSTGMDSLAMLFRRPLGLVNLSVIGGMQLGGPLELVMFKDYAESATGAPLALADPRRAAAMALFRTEAFDEAGLRLVDNTADELAEFGREMVALTTDGLVEDPGVAALGRDLIGRLYPDPAIAQARFRVSPAWLRARAGG